VNSDILVQKGDLYS